MSALRFCLALMVVGPLVIVSVYLSSRDPERSGPTEAEQNVPIQTKAVPALGKRAAVLSLDSGGGEDIRQREPWRLSPKSPGKRAGKKSLLSVQTKKALEIASRNLDKGDGITDFYYYLVKYDGEYPAKLRPKVDKARKLAEIELISIFKKPEEYGAKEIYLDNSDLEMLKHIVQEDEGLRRKFGAYLARVVPSQ